MMKDYRCTVRATRASQAQGPKLAQAQMAAQEAELAFMTEFYNKCAPFHPSR